MNRLFSSGIEVVRKPNGIHLNLSRTFGLPRDASAEDVAAELGVDAPTVAEHLQRAEKNLLRESFLSGLTLYIFPSSEDSVAKTL